VVVDVRNNNGGYINGYALDVFTRCFVVSFAAVLLLFVST